MTAKAFDSLGRKLPTKCSCPNCRSKITRVVLTNENEDGVTARKRKCPECGHVFFTAQEPEYLVRKEQITWVKGRPVFSEFGKKNAGQSDE